jgi:hypothetical protein
MDYSGKMISPYALQRGVESRKRTKLICRFKKNIENIPNKIIVWFLADYTNGRRPFPCWAAFIVMRFSEPQRMCEQLLLFAVFFFYFLVFRFCICFMFFLIFFCMFCVLLFFFSLFAFVIVFVSLCYSCLCLFCFCLFTIS